MDFTSTYYLKVKVFVLYLLGLFIHYFITLEYYFDVINRKTQSMFVNLDVISKLNGSLIEDISCGIHKCNNVFSDNSMLVINVLSMLTIIVSCFIFFNSLLIDTASVAVQTITDYSPYQNLSDFDYNLKIASEIFYKHFVNASDFSNAMFERNWRLNYWIQTLTDLWVCGNSSLQELSAIEKVLAALHLASENTKELHSHGQILEDALRCPEYNIVAGKDISAFLRCMKHYDKITDLLEQLRNHHFTFQK